MVEVTVVVSLYVLGQSSLNELAFEVQSSFSGIYIRARAIPEVYCIGCSQHTCFKVHFLTKLCNFLCSVYGLSAMSKTPEQKHVSNLSLSKDWFLVIALVLGKMTVYSITLIDLKATVMHFLFRPFFF